jgi:hypothetical protein
MTALHNETKRHDICFDILCKSPRSFSKIGDYQRKFKKVFYNFWNVFSFIFLFHDWSAVAKAKNKLLASKDL